MNLILLLCPFPSSAQLYLQIEKINSTERIKLGPGIMLSFKAPAHSDQWQTGTIKEIIYESQTIVFDHTFLTLKEISKIKIRNGTGEAFAWLLKGFGASWLVIGGLADLANLRDETTLDAQNISIGLGSIGSGYFIEKFGGDKIYTNNKTHRFRILDLRFSVD